MPSESGKVRKQAMMKVTGGAQSSHPPEPENLPCPRCESTNSKFCYYNNYNLSQPRYHCKACRRYWTRGGTLRNVPVGGGSRKNTKLSRPSSSAVTPNSPHTKAGSFVQQTEPFSECQVVAMKTEVPTCDVDLDMSEGSFTSLLTLDAVSGMTQPNGGPYVGLHTRYCDGLGLGFGPSSGFEDMGIGLTFWPMVMEWNQNGGNSCQLGNGSDRMEGGDCFGWPDLAISTPGNGLQ